MRLGRSLALPIARVLAGLALLGAVASAVLWHDVAWTALRGHPYFNARQVDIHGVGPLLSDAAVRQWLDLGAQTSLWDLEPTRVRARLESHPVIARAAVRREFPDRFAITLRERRPEAIAVLDRHYYLDRDGRLLGALAPEHSRDYPVVTGVREDTPVGVRTWLYRRALRLVRMCERTACLGGLSEINLHPERGVVFYPMRRRTAVTLGWGSWREKLARVERVLETEERYRRDVAAVDLRYRNQVVIERRERPPLRDGAQDRLRDGPFDELRVLLGVSESSGVVI